MGAWLYIAVLIAASAATASAKEWDWQNTCKGFTGTPGNLTPNNTVSRPLLRFVPKGPG
jgi:hypothetical protein